MQSVFLTLHLASLGIVANLWRRWGGWMQKGVDADIAMPVVTLKLNLEWKFFVLIWHRKELRAQCKGPILHWPWYMSMANLNKYSKQLWNAGRILILGHQAFAIQDFEYQRLHGLLRYILFISFIFELESLRPQVLSVYTLVEEFENVYRCRRRSVEW